MFTKTIFWLNKYLRLSSHFNNCSLISWLAQDSQFCPFLTFESFLCLLIIIESKIGFSNQWSVTNCASDIKSTAKSEKFDSPYTSTKIWWSSISKIEGYIGDIMRIGWTNYFLESLCDASRLLKLFLTQLGWWRGTGLPCQSWWLWILHLLEKQNQGKGSNLCLRAAF